LIALSSRFVLGIAALAALAAIPVAIHANHRTDVDDCGDPAALRAALLIPGSRPELGDPKHRAGELMRATGTIEPALSRFAPPLRYAIVRSFEPAEITHSPGRIVDGHLEAQKQELRWIERGDERLPVHWLEEHTRGMPAFAGFFFVYENRAVASPYRTLLGSALRRLTGGPRPISVFVVGGTTPASLVDEAQQQAEDWLFAAWSHYREVCLPSPGRPD
jgi:hypothetical protein